MIKKSMNAIFPLFSGSKILNASKRSYLDGIKYSYFDK